MADSRLMAKLVQSAVVPKPQPVAPVVDELCYTCGWRVTGRSEGAVASALIDHIRKMHYVVDVR